MKRFASALCLAAVVASSEAQATGFTDIGQDISPHPDTFVRLNGYYRLRGDALYNLDLDRGTTPSGKPLFPVPLDDPKAQTLTRADMRLRTDLAIYAPGGGFAVKMRADVFDNLLMGSTPAGSYPAGSTSQDSPANAIRVKRAYAEMVTPFGLVAAGRMGHHWGLGMLANGGDCADCNSGDAADRVALMTPIAGHIIGAAYDLTAIGPYTQRASDTRAIDLDRADDVRTVTVAILKWRDELARERRRKAGRITLDYGAYYSHRSQDKDIPASYVATSQPVAITPQQSMSRGYRADAADVWIRAVFPYGRIEAEAAVMWATIDQPSLIPGVMLRDPLKSRQIGAALESDLHTSNDVFGGGLDGGYASGDRAPGFGAYPPASTGAGAAGELEGPQANPPYDRRVDNFRFHPDYRVDRILFREIIGSVTDAVYVRPHARMRLFQIGPGALTASIAAVAAWAVQPASTPNNKNALGIEIDPTLTYRHKDGFACALEHAVLLPGAAFDNPSQHLSARTAQVFRVRMIFAF